MEEATENGKESPHSVHANGLIGLIDYEKAYDNMNRDKLWEMMDNKIPKFLLNTIKCIYRSMKVRIEFDDGISEPMHINKGVRQRCGLSPVFFNVCFNEILK
jgi:hypothetical protein